MATSDQAAYLGSNQLEPRYEANSPCTVSEMAAEPSQPGLPDHVYTTQGPQAALTVSRQPAVGRDKVVFLTTSLSTQALTEANSPPVPAWLTQLSKRCHPLCGISTGPD